MTTAAADKYHEAVELYRTTDLTITEISKRCGVTRSGLAVYIQRNHRDLMMRRNGLTGDPSKPVRRNKGQRPETRRKYREAIEACDSEEYLPLNISQIARIFHLDGPALANQLRTHYPDIIPRREAERRKRGLADNAPRGMRKESGETYESAVRLLRDSDCTVEEAADLCGVSFSGLRQHLIFYHKDLVDRREEKRREGSLTPKIGSISGNGRLRVMSDDVRRKYAEGVELYRTTSLSLKEIAERIGVNENTFRSHLRTWHRRLMFERRGADLPDGSSDREPLVGHKRCNKSTAEKYAEAIELLRSTETAPEAVAKKFGFVPEVFRAWLKEHEPDLFESFGMMTLPNGRRVLKRTYKKYREAIDAYSTSGETIKSIAARFGLNPKSLAAFIRRNIPDLPPAHK